eukprot:156902_1
MEYYESSTERNKQWTEQSGIAIIGTVNDKRGAVVINLKRYMDEEKNDELKEETVVCGWKRKELIKEIRTIANTKHILFRPMCGMLEELNKAEEENKKNNDNIFDLKEIVQENVLDMWRIISENKKEIEVCHGNTDSMELDEVTNVANIGTDSNANNNMSNIGTHLNVNANTNDNVANSGTHSNNSINNNPLMIGRQMASNAS